MSVIEQLLPFLHATGDLKTIRTRLRFEEKKTTELERSWQPYRELGEARLEKSLRGEHMRREQFHRRAQAFLGSMAVMSAFTIGGLGLVRAEKHGLPSWVLAISLLCTLLYLAGGAWSALMIISPSQLYDLNLQNQMDGSTPLDESERIDLLIVLVKLTEAQNLILAMLSERAYRFMRNGVVALMVSLFLLLCDATLS
jgi:hypothetical protein